MLYPEPIERLTEHLSKLPGIGRKTATRLAFFLLNARQTYVSDLSRSIADVKEKIRLCSTCYNITDIDPCHICRDDRRDKAVLCVVEEPSHLMVIESAYPGTYRYHILHGVINPIEGNTTAHYIAELTKPFNVRITRIASGIPVGGDIIYIDPLTIKSALDNRRNV